MNWKVLGLSDAAGRIALREPRVTDRLEMLCDLVKLRGGVWDDALYKSILTRIKVAAAKRDLLAHGIWVNYSKYRNEWHVQLARGQWPKNLRDLVKESRKVTPEGVVIDLTELRSATTEILELTDDLGRLRDSAYDAKAPPQEPL